MCKALGQLPRQGGLLEQDAYHMRLVRAGMAGLQAQEEEEAKKRNQQQKRRGAR